MHPDIPLALLPFVSPWLFAAGAAATSIPVVIHLLNRRRFRLKNWAAMEFLLAAMRRNVRRLKMQRWLLLLLRVLALLLLAAAIAQFTPVGAALAPLLGNSQRLTVVVLNNAYPMGLHPHGGSTPFHRAKRLLIAWLQSDSDIGRVAIINASHNAVSLAPRPELPSALLIGQVRNQKVSQAGEDLTTGLEQALAIVKKNKTRNRSRTVLLITDDAANNFGSIDGTHSVLRQRLAALVAAIRHLGAHLRIIDVGHRSAQNMAITDLQPGHPVVLVNQPLAVKYALFNAAAAAGHDVVLRFFLNSTPAGQTVLHTLPPGRVVTGEALLNQKVPLAGPLAITARLSPDALPADNTRRFVATAVKNIPVLLVDGRPGDPASGRLASTAWLGAALAPFRRNNIFKPTRIGDLELPDQSLKHFQSVVLSDLPPPGPRLAGRLRQFVSAGGLLIIYPGPDTNGMEWTDALGAGVKGLLPAAIGSLMSVTRSGEAGGGRTLGFDLSRSMNPVVTAFLAAEKSGVHTGLADVATRQYVVLRPQASVVARTLLYFANGAPALVERNIGHGKVLLWAISADTQWTDFPAQPAFPAYMHRLFFYTLANREASRNLRVGDRLNLPTHFAAGTWAGPRHDSLALTRKLIGGQPRLQSPPIPVAGLYGPAGSPALAAVNVDARWADVRHTPAARVAAILRIHQTNILENPKSLAAAQPALAAGGGNAGHNLLYLALAVLAAEALAARAFSRYQLAPAKAA